jgi:nucleotide-binding universal stress UspA family protein
VLPYFKNILVPVDFSINTACAIENALSLCDQQNTVIHLLHVTLDRWTVFAYDLNTAFTLPGDDNKRQHQGIKTKLAHLQASIHQQWPDVRVETIIKSASNVQVGILETAHTVEPDLIVIGKHNFHNRIGFLNAVNSSYVARETKAAVLNVVPGTLLSKIKSIVLPLRSFLPGRKLSLLPALTRKQKPTIHLVTMQTKNPNPVDSKVFIDTYRRLSQVFNYPVNHKVVYGNNTAKNIVKYANDIEADLVLLNPFDETSMHSIFGTQISDLPHLKFSILTAAAFSDKATRVEKMLAPGP